MNEISSFSYSKTTDSWKNHNETYPESVLKELKKILDTIHNLWVNKKINSEELKITISTWPPLCEVVKSSRRAKSNKKTKCVYKNMTTIEIIAKLKEVDQKFEVSAAELAESLRCVGISAEEASVSIDDLVCLI